MTNNYILENIDMVYIINLKNRNDRKKRILDLLDGISLNRNKIKFIDAINSKIDYYKKEYDEIIENIKFRLFNNDQKGFEIFIKWSFQLGAYGCLLSHLKIIKDAKKNSYKQILVLEDDITFKSSLIIDLNIAMNYVPSDWDFLYLGKKQGKIDIIENNCPYDLPYDGIYDLPYNSYITKNQYYLNNIKNNIYWYKPDLKTWASHAWLIKNNIFDELINVYETRENAVDILIQRLFNKYNIYVIKEDLFITSYDSDIREESEYEKSIHFNKWGWDINDFLPFKYKYNYISKILIYGFNDQTKKDHTHTYIHNSIYNAFKKHFPKKVVYHAQDNQSFILEHFKNSLIFLSPAQDGLLNIPKYESNIYLVHIDTENSYSHILKYFKNEIEDNRVLFLTCREYDYNKYFEYNDNNQYGIRSLCLPWAAGFIDHISILSNINKIKSLTQIRHHQTSDKNIVFFGSVWELTYNLIIKIAEISKKNNYNFTIIGRLAQGYYKDIMNANSNVIIKTFHSYKNDPNILDEYSSLIPENSLVLSLQGEEHNGNYFSCRVFNNIANRHLGISNNKLSSRFIGNILYNENIEELIYNAFNMNLEDYKITMGKQLIDLYFKHTYDNRIFEYVKYINKILNIHNIKSPKNAIKLDRPIDTLNKKYIIIIGFQRTGSSYLCEILNNFQNIFGAQEIFQSDKLGLNYDSVDDIKKLYSINYNTDNEAVLKNYYILEKRDTQHYINTLKLIEEITDKPIISFKIFPNHHLNISAVYELLSSANVIPIVLKRNFNDIYVSYKRAEITNNYSNNNYDNQKITFDKIEYELLSYMYNMWYELVENYMLENSINYHSITYENDINTSNFENKIREYIEIYNGLDIGNYNYQKINSFNKQSSDYKNYENIFENYKDFLNYCF